MRTNCNKLQVRDRPGESRDTAVEGWAKHWNDLGGRGALDCRCVGKEMVLPFVQCREDVDYEHLLVEPPAWMPEQADGLGDKPHPDYFFVSLEFDRVCFIDRHEYLTRDCDFEMHMRITVGCLRHLLDGKS